MRRGPVVSDAAMTHPLLPRLRSSAEGDSELDEREYGPRTVLREIELDTLPSDRGRRKEPREE